jgi:hypothetical protein
MTDRHVKTVQFAPSALDTNVPELIVPSAHRVMTDRHAKTAQRVPSADPATIVLLVPSAVNVTSVAHLPAGSAHALIT